MRMRRLVARPAWAAALVSVSAGVLVGATGCSTAATDYTMPDAEPASTVLPKPATTYIFGQIVSETPSGWTVKGIRGNIYTVTLTPRTDYGSLFHRARRDQFKVGANVRIAGIFSGTALTANAVDFSKPAGS